MTGNNPLVPKGSYASSDFDQTHVLLVNYSYTLPGTTQNKGLGRLVNGWVIGGRSVLQSGQPYAVYDYSGLGGRRIYYGTYDENRPTLSCRWCRARAISRRNFRALTA